MPCTAAIDPDVCTDADGCTRCIATIGTKVLKGAAADGLSASTSDKDRNKCQQEIQKSTWKFYGARSKIVQQCWDKRLLGKHSDDCPDASAPLGSAARKAADKIAKAATGMTEKICKTCGGDDGGRGSARLRGGRVAGLGPRHRHRDGLAENGRRRDIGGRGRARDGDAVPLGSLGLLDSDATGTPVGRMSQGQQRRLDLALALSGRPTLILLDEPTNHLDFDTLEVVEAALRAYRGTLVIATHDRALIEAVGCDRIAEVRDGRVREWDRVR